MKKKVVTVLISFLIKFINNNETVMKEKIFEALKNKKREDFTETLLDLFNERLETKVWKIYNSIDFNFIKTDEQNKDILKVSSSIEFLNKT